MKLNLNKNEIKTCFECQLVLPIGDFYKAKTNKDGFSGKCKNCSEKYRKIYYIQNKEKLKETAKWYMRQIRFNISKEDFNKKLNEQNFKCCICKENFNIKDPRSIHIDHNHNTGNLRGILCRFCNTGLGQFKDNIEYLNSAIEYLKTNNE